MRSVINKTNGRVLGSIIKMNRLHQNMSQKALSEGICVGSYLSRIENGEILPSEQVISQLFNALAINFNDSDSFILDGTQLINRFLEELNFNEFERSKRIFDEIDGKSAQFRHSPLIIDYYIARLAFYCTTPYRAQFDETVDLLKSVIDLMTNLQKFRFYLYEGIDYASYKKNATEALRLLSSAHETGENGHLWYWMGYVHLLKTNHIKAFECYTHALQYYLGEANLPSIMGSFEMMGLIYILNHQYDEAQSYFDKAGKIAGKLGSRAAMDNIINHQAWMRFNQGYTLIERPQSTASDSLAGHGIPFDIIEILEAVRYGDPLKAQLKVESIEPGSVSYVEGLKGYIKTYDYSNGLSGDEEVLRELIDQTPIQLSEYFKKQLIQYYKANRRYKEAVELLENMFE